MNVRPVALAVGIALALSAPTTANAETIHTPLPGAVAFSSQSVRFDWRWDADQYWTPKLVFTRSANPNDPIWFGGDQPGKVRVNLDWGGTSNTNITPRLAGIEPGQWYWRPCSYIVDGEDDKCYLRVAPQSFAVVADALPPAPPPLPPTSVPTVAPAPVKPAPKPTTTPRRTQRCMGRRSVGTSAVRITAFDITTSPGRNVNAYSCATARRVASALAARRIKYLPCTDNLDSSEVDGCTLSVRGLPRFSCYRTGTARLRVQCVGARDRSVQLTMIDRQPRGI